jgi:hypothetical protein
VYDSFFVLAIGAVLNRGRQTVCGALRSYPFRVSKSWSSFHHFLSHTQWRPLQLSRILATLLLDARQPVTLIVDDTLIRRRGSNVFRISKHRDPIRSGKGQNTVFALGHAWLVVAVSFQTRLRKRTWALPVFIFPEIPKRIVAQEYEKNGKRQGQYRSPTHLVILALRLLRRWFPQRDFVVLADGTLNTHELHRFVATDDLQCLHQSMGHWNHLRRSTKASED